MSVRRVVMSAAATILLLALAACGGNDKATDPSSSSSSASPSASSGKLTGEEFAAILEAALGKATTAHVTVDRGKTASAEGDADFTTTPPEAALKMSLAQLGGDIEVRMVGGTLYLKSPSFGDKWVSASLDDPKSPLGEVGGELDVTKTLQTFADAVVSATDEGSEDVDGESLEHYQATVDTRKLVSSLSSSGADTGSLSKTMDQDWWFDSDGLLRKFSTDLGGQPVTVTLSKWGEGVSIEAPPADQVTQMPAMDSAGES